jgi:hypothetical protein
MVFGDKIKESESAAAPVTGTIGQPVKDGQFTLVAKSVKCGPAYEGSPPSDPPKEFCKVDLSVFNHGTRP